MIEPIHLAGSFTLPGASMTVNRMGYGAMQLAGPEVWGPPRDVDAAIAVLREAVESGVNHIDTSDYYGPHVTNQLIKKALHPYLDGLVIVTKVDARRGSDKSWLHALSWQELLDAVHDNTTFHPGNGRGPNRHLLDPRNRKLASGCQEFDLSISRSVQSSKLLAPPFIRFLTRFVHTNLITRASL